MYSLTYFVCLLLSFGCPLLLPVVDGCLTRLLYSISATMLLVCCSLYLPLFLSVKPEEVYMHAGRVSSPGGTDHSRRHSISHKSNLMRQTIPAQAGA